MKQMQQQQDKVFITSFNKQFEQFIEKTLRHI